MKIEFVLNGRSVALDVAPLTRLLDVLREHFGLTGTKEGCGEGECGTCSVLVDDEVVNACLLPVVQVEGRRVETVESLSRDEPGTLAEAFLARDGAQCGFCTPGMIMAGEALRRRCAGGREDPDDAAVRVAIAGNLCRCTGYQKIVAAIRSALDSDRRNRGEGHA